MATIPVSAAPTSTPTRTPALDMRGGNLLWNREVSSYAGLDVDERQVYVSDDADAVLALDRRTGGTLWRQAELTGRRLSAPVATRDHVVVGDFEGYLHWLSKDSGKIVGRIRAAGKAIVAPPFAAGVSSAPSARAAARRPVSVGPLTVCVVMRAAG